MKRDFSPSLLELVDTPPSPLPHLVLRGLLLLFAAVLVWASVGKLDIVAEAEGRLVPRTFVKIVQPAEAGRLAEILVSAGDKVERGQVIMRMDRVVVEAESRALQTQIAVQRLRLQRILAEQTGKPMVAGNDEPAELLAQTEAELRTNRAAYQSEFAELGNVLQKTREELEAAKIMEGKLKQTLPLLKSREAAMAKLEARGYLGTLDLLNQQRERQEHEHNLEAQRHEIARLTAAENEAKDKLGAFSARYQANLQSQRIEVLAALDKLQEELAIHHHRSSLQDITAPQRGTIKELATHTSGAVVQQGAILAYLVPDDETLQGEVWIKNEDVGFAFQGQPARIKIQAFPFQKYGLLDGRVTLIDADASADSDVNLDNRRHRDDGGLAYRALISLEPSTDPSADTLAARLVPGMRIVAELKQGERTVLEYLLAPLQKALLEAARER